MLDLPLEKRRTVIIAFHAAEISRRQNFIIAECSSLSQYQSRIEFIDFVSTLVSYRKCAFGVSDCRGGIGGLDRKPRQTTQGIIDALLTVNFFCKAERLLKRLTGQIETALIH